MDERTYSHSLVAVFPHRSEAEAARQELFRNGFNADQVELHATQDVRREASSGNAGLSEHKAHSEGGGIASFFRHLFSGHATDDDRRYYARAADRGDTVLVVHTNDVTAGTATGILKAFGAVDVDERDPAAEQTRVRIHRRPGILDPGTPVPSFLEPDPSVARPLNRPNKIITND